MTGGGKALAVKIGDLGGPDGTGRPVVLNSAIIPAHFHFAGKAVEAHLDCLDMRARVHKRLVINARLDIHTADPAFGEGHLVIAGGNFDMMGLGISRQIHWRIFHRRRRGNEGLAALTFGAGEGLDLDLGKFIALMRHREIERPIKFFRRLVGEAVQTAVDVTLSLEGLYDLEYGVDFAYRMDVFERMEAISFDKDEDDPEKILAALTPLLEVMELDRIWLELSDQGLLDFVVWSAKQAREEETITDADLRLLGADIVPSLVRGIEPLNKPEAIVALQNFVLNGGMISIDVLPLMTGNMAWLNEAFIAGHMPINVDVMHRY